MINTINSKINPAFSARLVCNRSVTRNLSNDKSDIQTKELIIKISEAFEKHPSNAVVKPDIFSKQGLYGARGIISSRYATYKDVEPVTNDGISPIKNILRRILDPENKDCFNKLLGSSDNELYDSWWTNNIEPIWNDINSCFRSNKFFKGNHDKEFNQDFQNRREKTWYKLLNKEV